jgi:hypothetical protein
MTRRLIRLLVTPALGFLVAALAADLIRWLQLCLEMATVDADLAKLGQEGSDA